MARVALCLSAARPGLHQQLQRQPQRPQSRLPCRAGKGFGSGSSAGGGSAGSGSGSSSRSGGDIDRLQDAVREARQVQLSASDMLAKLLQADDPKKVAAENVESLTEAFFQASNAYLTMAKKEGNAVVTQHIETALRAALEAKQATLRPEIQLLNRLLGAETQEQRQRILIDPDAVDTLLMNDRYFFGLLQRMQSDVGRMPDNPQKAALVERLDSIRQAADAAVAGA